MKADKTRDAAAPPYQDGAHPQPVRGRCWPLPTDSAEAQIALPAGDGAAGDEAALAGAVRARRRRHRTERRARAVLPPCTLELDVPARTFDELRAASLACAEPGGSGHRAAYEEITVVFATEPIVSVRFTSR